MIDDEMINDLRAAWGRILDKDANCGYSGFDIDHLITELQLKAKITELQAMIDHYEKAASKHLPAYREAAMKLLDSETKRMELQSIVSNHRIIEWFNAVEDTNKQYLEKADYHLKGRIEYAQKHATKP